MYSVIRLAPVTGVIHVDPEARAVLHVETGSSCRY